MLALALNERYRLTSLEADIIDAIMAVAKAVATGGPDLAMALNNQAIVLHSRYAATGDPTVLTESIAAARQSVELSAPDEPDLHPRLATLARCLVTYYWCAVAEGGAADVVVSIGEAVALNRRALDLTPGPGPDRNRYRGNLIEALLLRYDLLGEDTDLDAALAQCGDDLSADAAATVPRGTRLVAASRAFAAAAGVRASGDLDRAVELARSGVAMLTGLPDEPSALTALGTALRLRHAYRNDRADIDESVACLQRSYDLTAAHASQRSTRQSNLATAIFSRYQAGGDPADLLAAEAHLQELLAQALTIEVWARAVLWTAQAVVARLESSDGRDGSLTAVFADLRQLATTTAVNANIRLLAATYWARTAADHQRPTEAAAAGVAAVDALAALVWRGTSRRTRERRLSGWQSAARDAAGASLVNGDVAAAVELLDRGRALLWEQEVRPRRAADELRAEHPGLADELDRLRLELDGLLDREPLT
jgi:hypothetical protein